MKSLDSIENKEVREEVGKLLGIFPEGFINDLMELVICHPFKYHGKRSCYCNVFFRLDGLTSKEDVQAKVLEWWSRGACKALFHDWDVSSDVHKYIREGINRYLGTCLSDKDMWLVYDRLGNSVRHNLTMMFIESGFDMEMLKRNKHNKGVI